jgi:hypothetical protein
MTGKSAGWLEDGRLKLLFLFPKVSAGTFPSGALFTNWPYSLTTLAPLFAERAERETKR